MKTISKSGSAYRISCYLASFLACAAILITCASCIWMKMDPAPDADKVSLTNNNSCYLATASNMLAGAGYGTGNTVQARADEIYGEMITEFTIVPGGWTDAALDWWLGSTNNTWPNNPYTVVTVDGNKSPAYPWANPDGPRDIGNYLRDCDFIGLSISSPTNAPGVIGDGGHAITGWGDNGGNATLAFNPSRVRVTDSDRDTGGDVQSYTWDSYTNPNPGGANEGNGWYFDYYNNHPYVKHIIRLSPIRYPSGNKRALRVLGSFEIHQSGIPKATDLHYEVGTDTDILSYKTSVDWETENPPSIIESEPQRRQLDVDWDFSDNPVPFCTSVTITTEFILPAYNAIWYKDVRFTYPEGVWEAVIPHLYWEMETPTIERPTSIPNVTGGYVVGSFEIINPELPLDERVIGRYRFIHQYGFNQSPENHVFILEGEQGYRVANINFGHSYGYLDKRALWEFSDWMTEITEREFDLGNGPVEIPIDWEGRLPYPEGEDVKGLIPDIKRGLMEK